MFWIIVIALQLTGVALLFAAERTKRDAFGYVGGAIVVLTMLYVIASYAPLI